MNKNILVVDNFMSEDMIEYMNHYFMNSPHSLHRSKHDSNNYFYNLPLDIENPLIHIFYNKIAKYFLKNKYKPLRSYVNIQHKNMDGEFHTDDGDLTCLLMVSSTLKKGEGIFETENGKKIDFIQNRLIMFNANISHKGMAPKTKTIRMTLALKLGKI